MNPIIPMSYTEMFTDIHRLDFSPKRFVTLPPVQPVGKSVDELRQLLEKLAAVEIKYPPELLKVRREWFIAKLIAKGRDITVSRPG